jgi:dynein heavy chain
MATSIGKPHFDVNISNHVSLVNFFVTVEGLTHNLLSEVVANERKDLEQVYNENIKQMYEKIKNLKEIKKHIIGSMETDVHEILHDENLINTLNESKETAESIAKHLKKISSTN